MFGNLKKLIYIHISLFYTQKTILIIKLKLLIRINNRNYIN